MSNTVLLESSRKFSRVLLEGCCNFSIVLLRNSVKLSCYSNLRIIPIIVSHREFLETFNPYYSRQFQLFAVFYEGSSNFSPCYSSSLREIQVPCRARVTRTSFLFFFFSSFIYFYVFIAGDSSVSRRLYQRNRFLLTFTWVELRVVCDRRNRTNRRYQ